MKKSSAIYLILLLALVGAATGVLASLLLHFPEMLQWGLFGAFVAGSSGVGAYWFFKKETGFDASTSVDHFGSKGILMLHVNAVFLFNALHNIAAQAQVDAQIAGQTAEQLADYIRTVKEIGGKKYTSLAEEIKCADLYLKIEKGRFGDNLEIIRDIAPDCLEVKIPSLLLQPIVENAVRHGVELSSRPSQVILSARSTRDNIVIEITDTGKGIDIEKSDMLLEKGPSLSIIRQRLYDYYRKHANMKIDALVPSGTRVQITLPKKHLSSNISNGMNNEDNSA